LHDRAVHTVHIFHYIAFQTVKGGRRGKRNGRRIRSRSRRGGKENVKWKVVKNGRGGKERDVKEGRREVVGEDEETANVAQIIFYFICILLLF
jgi:hypothetical protein